MAKGGVLEFVQEEDYVEYFLFPKELSTDDPPSIIKQALEENVSLISCTVAEYMQAYIWHKDPFNISIRESTLSPDGTVLPPHLYGISHYGDNIEDEWFIVFLLTRLTKDIDGLVVRVVDSDGEFLLIEAAEYLPSGANPETCKEKVFLYNGEVHMVPLPSTGNKNSKELSPFSLTKSIQMVRRSPDITQVNQHIQNAVTARIKGYPSKIKDNLHRATVFVPVGVAAILKENPSLISPAVRSFCHRDPIDMRACRAMRYFPPENCVMTSVVFTRCLYAMISHQKFTPDRRTGWTLPPTSSNDYKAYSLGVKLACGFEILANQVKLVGDNVAGECTDDSEKLENLLASRGWSMYLESLKQKGYFKDLLEGSKDYSVLLQRAQEFYVQNCAAVSRGVPEVSCSHDILSLLNKLDIDMEEMKKASQNVPPPDDESWLEINPEELDRILAERYGPLDDKTQKVNLSNPHEITATLNSFLEHVSGLDGAEYPSATLSSSGHKIEVTKEAGGSVVPEELTNSMVDSHLNFDPDSFSTAVQNILDFVIPEDSWDLDSGTDDSKMGSDEDESELDLQQSETSTAGKNHSPQMELKQYMDQMDRELASSTIADSFVKKQLKEKTKKKSKQDPSNEDVFDDIEDFQPVDIDMNALKNILESYQSQLGGAGPASNLLGPMGVHLETLTSKSLDPKE